MSAAKPKPAARPKPEPADEPVADEAPAGYVFVSRDGGEPRLVDEKSVPELEVQGYKIVD